MTAVQQIAPTRALSGVELLQLVGRIAADTAFWREKVCLPTDDERWWTQLLDGDNVDVWLLSWLPGQTTELHDHGRSTAAFTVVEGSLREVRLDRRGRRSDKQRRAGAATVVPPGIIHDVNGSGTGPAVSIHAYSPKLTTMNFYAEGPDGRPRMIESAEVDGPER